MNAIPIGLITAVSLAGTALAEHSAVNLLPGIATAQSSSYVETSSSWADSLYFTTDLGINWMPNVGLEDLGEEFTGSTNFIQATSLDYVTDLGIRWDIGIGYEVNDHFRLQLESGYIHNDVSDLNLTLSGDLPVIGLPSFSVSGSVKDLDVLGVSYSGSMTQVPIMVAGIYDFAGKTNYQNQPDKSTFASWRFRPYIGGGIGAVHLKSSSKLMLGANQLDLGGNAWTFGYQALVGLEYQVGDNAFLSISYRFLGLSGANFGRARLNGVAIPRTIGGWTTDTEIKTKAVYNHSLQFGLRIEF